VKADDRSNEVLGREIFGVLEEAHENARRRERALHALIGEPGPTGWERKLARRYEAANAALFELLRRVDTP